MDSMDTGHIREGPVESMRLGWMPLPTGYNLLY